MDGTALMSDHLQRPVRRRARVNVADLRRTIEDLRLQLAEARGRELLLQARLEKYEPRIP
jgi:hypothetical protein